VESSLAHALYQRMAEGLVWDMLMRPSLTLLQMARIVNESSILRGPELELSESSFISSRDGGSVAFILFLKGSGPGRPPSLTMLRLKLRIDFR
ncbi:hypothetical protein Dimus_018519, partial [Dionaea muscipula]